MTELVIIASQPSLYLFFLLYTTFVASGNPHRPSPATFTHLPPPCYLDLSPFSRRIAVPFSTLRLLYMICIVAAELILGGRALPSCFVIKGLTC